jgi:hypothetical protein
MRNVLVAVDGTPASEDALSWGRGLAADQGAASLDVVSVLDPRPADGPAGPEILDALRRERRAALTGWTSGGLPGLDERIHLLGTATRRATWPAGPRHSDVRRSSCGSMCASRATRRSPSSPPQGRATPTSSWSASTSHVVRLGADETA